MKFKNKNTITTVLIGLLLLIMLFLMIGNAHHKKLSYDEPHNLRYGYRFLSEGPLATPEGQRMPILALNALGCVSFQCDSTIMENSERARLIARLPSMIFMLLTGWIIYLWAFQLYGRKAGVAALALFAFNPNFIAHGKELTSDAAAVFFTLATLYFFWKFLSTSRARYFAVTALIFGGGIVSKFSILILLPVLAAIFIWDAVTHNKKYRPSKIITAGVLFAGIVWLVINGAYGFQGTFNKASGYEWQSKSYQKFKDIDLPLLLPKIFVEGLDLTSYLEENPHIGRGNNYILGKRHRKGRWFSFPIMVLLKTPLPFFILIFLAFLKRSKPGEPLAFIWLPFAAWMLIFSVACNAQLGIRYILPCLTFPIIFTARLWQGAVPPDRRLLFLLLIGGYIVSSLSWFPHMISYFNEAIGPRINAYKFLADSNLDWEDKEYFTDQFIKLHPEMNIKVRPMEPAAGYLIIPANDLTGVLDEQRFQWLRDNFTPLRHITYSHYLFNVPSEKLREILAKPKEDS